MPLSVEKGASARPRWQVNEIADGIRIRIAPRRRWFLVLFLLLWLGGWAIGEGSALRQLAEEDTANRFLVFWLIGWTLGGLSALGTVLWQLVGEVVLEISQGVLRHRLSLGFLSVGRTYKTHLIRGLRSSTVAPGASNWLGSSDRGFRGRGLILFDYGERSVSIRPDLEPNEASNVVTMLGRHIPGSVA